MPPRTRNITSPPAVVPPSIEWKGFFDVYRGKSHALIFPNNPVAVPEFSVTKVAFRNIIHYLDWTRPITDQRFYSLARILLPVPQPLICDIIFIGDFEEVLRGIVERNNELIRIPDQASV